MKLADILTHNEEWLMERILMYAKRQDYTKYTSTLIEAWRLSIEGISESIINALDSYDDIPEMSPEEDFINDPVAHFGIDEAVKHRERGVSLSMFLGLMKYYRQSYIDLIKEQKLQNEIKDQYELFINRSFDRIEIGFCVEWSGSGENKSLKELQINNRSMTNEKNKYLTLFESLPTPVIIVNKDKKVDNMNLAGASLFQQNPTPGSQYYFTSKNEKKLEGENIDSTSHEGTLITELLPWIKEEINLFYKEKQGSVEFESSIGEGESKQTFWVKLSANLDVSGKFDGTVIILENITFLKKTLDEVKNLRGFVPICASCKNIRNDKGFWQEVEGYVQEHSEAQFSHSICPDCANKLYPEYNFKEYKTKP